MGPAVRGLSAGRRGFSLIELLVVIAIIALLVGLLFPVLATARENARRGQCMSNMRVIIQALKMYKDDWRVFPDVLFGYQLPARPFETRLFPDYVKDRGTFHCPNGFATVPGDPAQLGTLVDFLNPMTGQTSPYLVPEWSNYDFQSRPNNNDPTRVREARYLRKWTPGATTILDDPRQLIYRNPPDSTLVTWCLFHAELDERPGAGYGMPKENRQAVVGFIGGQVQTIPAEKFALWPPECVTPGPQGPRNCPWQVAPKP